MPTTLGAHSPRLDAVRALLTKRGRRDQERFTFEGATLLGEALDSGVQPEAVYADDDGYRALREAGLEERLECPVFLVPGRALGRISDLETPPGIVAVAAQRLEPLDALLAAGGPALLLAGISDPGNAGTLLRSAEAFGVASVLFGKGAVEPYNPKVVRGSMGAIFRLRLGSVAPDEVVAAAERFGYAIVAADRDGVPLADFAFQERVIVAVGHERKGVAGWLPRWDSAVAIPQRGRGESLNAAVAGSIVLYEFERRSPPGGRGLSTREKP
jgi:TrmH family RNA methyltransferase